MSNIKLEYIDETLISGSTDRLRSTLNKSWEFVEGDSGDVYEFDGSADEEDNIYISKIESNLNLAGSNTGSAIINSYTFPIRIYGDGDEIDSTETWKAFLYGGTAVSKTFQGIYSTDIYSDNHISLEAPYTNIERLIMNSIEDLAGVLNIQPSTAAQTRKVLRVLISEKDTVLDVAHLILDLFAVQFDLPPAQIESWKTMPFQETMQLLGRHGQGAIF